MRAGTGTGTERGDVVVRVTHSGINYKDALAASGAGKILRRYPLVGGIETITMELAQGLATRPPSEEKAEVTVVTPARYGVMIRPIF